MYLDIQDKYPVDKTLHFLFEEQAAKSPDHIAVVGTDVQITFRELNERAGRLAGYLSHLGVSESEPVGFMIERSVEMIIGVLAIMKTGGIYLPINFKNPQSRIDYIIKDSGAKVIVTMDTFKEIGDIIKEENPGNQVSFSLKTKPGSFCSDNRLAYIIYTSGSTGKPKGVIISHWNVSPLMYWGYNHTQINSDDRAIQNTSYYFDWFIWEVFHTLTSGASLHMVSDEILLDSYECSFYMEKHRITIFNVTPTQLRYLLVPGIMLKNLRFLLLAGEKFPVDLLKKCEKSVPADCRIFNLYGPTETTILSTSLEIDRSCPGKYDELSSVPIGRALGNTGLLILDNELNPCSENEWGELYIAGDGVSQGYLNNPELTAERFVTLENVVLPPSSYSRRQKTQHPVLYRSGDRVRQLSDGNIEFLERIDFQVKIRGLRIELGEIERQVRMCKGVSDAVVLAKEDTSGEKSLCAYIICSIPAETDSVIIGAKDYLSGIIPDYMIPSNFIPIEKFPLNPNGKIDINALPAPNAREYTPPRDKIEEKLISIWADTLGIQIKEIGIDDNFLELGGHSLKASLMSARIHEEFNVKISNVEVFKLKNVRSIGEHVKKESGKDIFIAIQPGEEKEYYTLSPSQNRFYFLYQIDPGSTVYNILEVLVFEGDLDIKKIEATFCKLISRHDSLRTSFPTVGKNPVQLVREHVDFSIQYLDSPGQEPGKIIRDFVRPFDLKQSPLMRIRLVKTAEKTHLCLFDIHHIIFDLVSLELFIKEFVTIYTGKPDSLPPLKLQYKDYSEWQNELIVTGEIKKQENFWLNEFSNRPPNLSIPTDYERPKIQSFEGENIIFEIPADESDKLKEYAAQEDTTMFVVMITIFYIFLGKLSNEEDIVIGTPTAGRRYAELYGIIGLFINTLALRNFPKAEKTFLDFLKEVKQRTLEAFDNQDYQFEDLVRNIKIKRDEVRNPLYDVLFTYRWERAGTLSSIDSRLNIKKLEIKQSQIMLDLVLVVNELEHLPQLYVSIGYCSKLFKRETIEEFIKHFKQIVSQVVRNKHILIKDIKIIHDLGIAESDVPQMDFAF